MTPTQFELACFDFTIVAESIVKECKGNEDIVSQWKDDLLRSVSELKSKLGEEN